MVETQKMARQWPQGNKVSTRKKGELKVPLWPEKVRISKSHKVSISREQTQCGCVQADGRQHGVTFESLVGDMLCSRWGYQAEGFYKQLLFRLGAEMSIWDQGRWSASLLPQRVKSRKCLAFFFRARSTQPVLLFPQLTQGGNLFGSSFPGGFSLLLSPECQESDGSVTKWLGIRIGPTLCWSWVVTLRRTGWFWHKTPTFPVGMVTEPCHTQEEVPTLLVQKRANWCSLHGSQLDNVCREP